MAGNVLERNIIYFHGDAKAYSMRNVAWDHNRVDANLLYHFGQPLKTGITKTGKDLSANLLPNGSFEDGKPNALPTGWTWNVHIPKAQAGSVTDQHVDGERALRIVGIKDGNKHPQINSPLVEMKPGAAYRLTAKVRGDTPGTTAALIGQWYEAKVGYWAREQAITFDDATVNRWHDVELVFTTPAPGESAYKPQMKQMRVRVDFRSDAGTLWVDDVKPVEVERLDEWQSWQAAGNDRQSQIADPLFVAPDHDDFRLRPESPAFKLGFKPIPVEQIGPYASPNRASWPIVQADGAREHR
jgi:hypothetical protein